MTVQVLTRSLVVREMAAKMAVQVATRGMQRVVMREMVIGKKGWQYKW